MTKHNIWSVSIITIVFALLLTPLIVSGSLYFPYVTGKVLAFRLGMSLALVAWAILVLKRPEFLPRKSGLLVASGGFVAWLAVANVLGADPAGSFLSNFERMEGWFTHTYLFAFLVILSTVIRTDKLWNWLLNSSVAIANILVLTATFSDEQRTSAFLGNSTYVAVYALFNLFFAALLAYRLYESQIRDAFVRYGGYVYYALSAVSYIYIILRTQTRGTAIALFVSGLVLLALTALAYRRNTRVWVTSAAIIALIALGGILFWTNRDAAFIQNNPMLARIATISATEGTGKARLMNWGIAFEGIKERPVFGWGQENYMYVFPKYYDPGMYAQEPWFDRTHNAFLDWTIQGGVVALGFYLALFVVAGLIVWKSASLKPIEKNLLLTLLVAYAIHNMFVFDNYSSYLMFFLTLGLIAHHQHKSTVFMGERARQIMAAILVICVLVAGYVVILKPYVAGRNLIKALSATDAVTFLDQFEALSKNSTLGDFEITTRLISAAPSFLKTDNQQIRQRYLDLARFMGDRELERNPESVRALEFYGTYLVQVGDGTRSVELLEKARTIAPDRHLNLYALGFAYIASGQNQKAVEVFKHAYEIQTENDRARQYYGAALLLNGDKSGEALLEGYSHNDSFFMTVFSMLGRHADVVKILEKQVAERPTDYQLQVSLAIAYAQAGNRTKAIEVIREVIKAVPAFKAQGENFIKQVQAGGLPTKK